MAKKQTTHLETASPPGRAAANGGSRKPTSRRRKPIKAADTAKSSPRKANNNNDLSTNTRRDPSRGRKKTGIRFKSLCDIRRFLARTLNDLDGDTINESKARTLGYLCSVMRDIIKDSDLEARVLKLEKELEKRE
jgi:hypothetical protein